MWCELDIYLSAAPSSEQATEFVALACSKQGLVSSTTVHCRTGHGVADICSPIPPVQESTFRSGRIFPGLAAAKHEEADLRSLALQIELAPPAADSRDNERDPEDNCGIPAGYTFLGAFTDHDITFPQLGADQASYSPPSFGDYAPPFQLHSVYGHGPRMQPYLYDRVRIVVGGHDLRK